MIYFNVYSHFLKKFYLIGIDYPTESKLEDLKECVNHRITSAVHVHFMNDEKFTEIAESGFIAVECMYYNPETATCSFTPMTKESFFFEI